MVNFEGLKAEFEDKQAALERRKQQKRDLQERRGRVEQERWETPERAYRTWEYRTRRIAEIADRYAQMMLETGNEAWNRYKDRRFNLYKWSSYYGDIYPHTSRTGQISVSECVCVQSHHSPMWGYRILYNDVKGEEPFKHGWLAKRKSIMDDANSSVEEFRKIMREIYEPLITYHVMNRYGLQWLQPELFKLATDFFEHGPRLRGISNPSKYSFECSYGGGGELEDEFTRLYIDGHGANAYNPVQEKRIMHLLREKQPRLHLPDEYFARLEQTRIPRRFGNVLGIFHYDKDDFDYI